MTDDVIANANAEMLISRFPSDPKHLPQFGMLASKELVLK